MNVTITSELPAFLTLSTSQLLAHSFATLFPLSLLAFDIILLTATIFNRRDTSIPVAYTIVMSIRGIMTTSCLGMQYFIYLILTSTEYQKFLLSFGPESTMVGTFSYLNALCINTVMSINRVVIVIKPFNKWFTYFWIFVYTGTLAFLLLISLIIPYLGPCYITFIVNKQNFVSACAPGRHPITTFQNTYAIILPFSCMFVNLGIILHLRFVRNNFYKNLWNKLKGETVSISRSTQSKMNSRRDVEMIRQTIAIASYLSFYEFGGFIIKVFPELYTSLSQTGKEIYFYVKLETIPFINVFIYFIMTKKTRQMVYKFLGIKDKKESAVVMVSQRTASGQQGNSITI